MVGALYLTQPENQASLPAAAAAVLCFFFIFFYLKRLEVVSSGEGSLAAKAGDPVLQCISVPSPVFTIHTPT